MRLMFHWVKKISHIFADSLSWFSSTEAGYPCQTYNCIVFWLVSAHYVMFHLQNMVIKPWRNGIHFHNNTLTYVRDYILSYQYRTPFDHDLEMLLIASILQANFGQIYYFSKFAVLKIRNSIQKGMAILPQRVNYHSHFSEIFQ